MLRFNEKMTELFGSLLPEIPVNLQQVHAFFGDFSCVSCKFPGDFFTHFSLIFACTFCCFFFTHLLTLFQCKKIYNIY